MSLSVSASSINWGTAMDVFAASGVVNCGAMVEAFDAGGSTFGCDQTENGVLFVGTTALLNRTPDNTSLRLHFTMRRIL